MFQKFTIGLILTLTISLLWLAIDFTKTSIAKEGEASAGYRAELSSPDGASFSRRGQVEETPTPEGSVTALSGGSLYLPLVIQNYCPNPFVYNEDLNLLYNMAKINAYKVWQCNQGSGIIVAVVDTGVDLDHPDLWANIVTGKSFVPGTSSSDDDHGHGTHVAGTIAGLGNNGGIIGVAPRAKIMPVKVINYWGSGNTYDIADGIRWAADHGARIINMSLGGVTNSSTIRDAVNYADTKGILLVAAGGNCGDETYFLNDCSYQDQPVYPAAFSNVFAVGSTDKNDNQSSFSNKGNYIDIAAPGSEIFSTLPGGWYGSKSGTSMASPHVAGLAALVWSSNTSLTSAQVRAQISNTANDLGFPGKDDKFGYGRINAAKGLGVLQTALVTSDDFSPPEESSAPDSQAPFVLGEILFKPRAGLNAADVLDLVDKNPAVKVTDQIIEIGVRKLAVPAGQEEAWLAALRDSGQVEYVELNYIITLQ